ncbi:hypothetical protein VK792_18460 [Mesobacterium sp. TK19101]|uniref:Uncharacterized protein n=1 Tax=Mesobacterium hydrothermale TaxID=3111907 RepID=A0ABU6HME5_9RHOB|nr:hypothetical protein [Mesobacterium sp. TK19101]MEC3863277.1 hypothetical protein [Mesobacterium sp. TK19101]
MLLQVLVQGMFRSKLSGLFQPGAACLDLHDNAGSAGSRTIGRVVAISCPAVFLRPFNAYVSLAQQAANAVASGAQTEVLSLFRHPMTGMAAQADAALCRDVRPRSLLIVTEN